MCGTHASALMRWCNSLEGMSLASTRQQVDAWSSVSQTMAAVWNVYPDFGSACMMTASLRVAGKTLITLSHGFESAKSVRRAAMSSGRFWRAMRAFDGVDAPSLRHLNVPSW